MAANLLKRIITELVITFFFLGSLNGAEFEHLAPQSEFSAEHPTKLGLKRFGAVLDEQFIDKEFGWSDAHHFRRISRANQNKILEELEDIIYVPKVFPEYFGPPGYYERFDIYQRGLIQISDAMAQGKIQIYVARGLPNDVLAIRRTKEDRMEIAINHSYFQNFLSPDQETLYVPELEELVSVIAHAGLERAADDETPFSLVSGYSLDHPEAVAGLETYIRWQKSKGRDYLPKRIQREIHETFYDALRGLPTAQQRIKDWKKEYQFDEKKYGPKYRKYAEALAAYIRNYIIGLENRIRELDQAISNHFDQDYGPRNMSSDQLTRSISYWNFINQSIREFSRLVGRDDHHTAGKVITHIVVRRIISKITLDFLQSPQFNHFIHERAALLFLIEKLESLKVQLRSNLITLTNLTLLFPSDGYLIWGVSKFRMFFNDVVTSFLVNIQMQILLLKKVIQGEISFAQYQDDLENEYLFVDQYIQFMAQAVNPTNLVFYDILIEKFMREQVGIINVENVSKASDKLKKINIRAFLERILSEDPTSEFRFIFKNGTKKTGRVEFVPFHSDHDAVIFLEGDTKGFFLSEVDNVFEINLRHPEPITKPLLRLIEQPHLLVSA